MRRLRTQLLAGLAVHHSGQVSDQPEGHEHCTERVQAIQRLHQRDRGWADIAYHWVVCGHGVVFDGRDPAFVGAHAGSLLGNSRYLAVCVLGHSSTWPGGVPPRVDLALRLVRHVVLSRQPRAVRVWPHLRFRRTECPGAVLREWCRRYP